MKKRVFSIFLALCMAVVLLPTAAMAATTPFTDVPFTHWAATEITDMVDAGAIQGYKDGTFKPSNSVTGIQFCRMIGRQYYVTEIAAATGDEATIFTKVGVNGGVQFNYNDPITRYNMAAVMYAVLQHKGVQAQELSDTSVIGDWSSIPSTYQKAVSICYNLGLLTGTKEGTFNGAGVMNRAQAAAVMSRLANSVAKGSTSSTQTPASPVSSIPAGAKVITGSDVVDIGTFTYKDGVFVSDYTDWDGNAGGGLDISNNGYTKLTFTVTTAAARHQISVLGLHRETPDPTDNKLCLPDAPIQDANTTATYTADVSGARNLQLQVCHGTDSYCTVSNIYLHN
ncbi:putative surface layer protein [Oscillibacter valericigenes Sjm18-20]|nr:putative surface layer protein [Oscillibacter valericigenes Sjm18-20]